MRLDQIIKGTGASIIKGNADTEITSICCDSRKAKEGCAFIAVKGYSSDGHAYIDAAVNAGATAVIDADRKALALCADNFYSHPSGKLKLVGITGTNGKTTTVTLLYHMFRNLGYECGLLSTIANYVGARRSETENTTADPITINSLLSDMVDIGCEYCFMEVSSIGVEQDRVAGLEFKVGIFSNLTHDHLDYHKTFAEYLRCKKKFFDDLGMTTAVGGGVVRDILLGTVPPAAFQKPVYALVAVAVSLVVFIPAIGQRIKSDNPVLLVMDTLGLAVFTAVGTRAGIPYSNTFLALFVGVVTGVGGGVIRDLFAGNRPYIFIKHFYACASLAGSVVMVVLWPFGEKTAMIAGILVIITLRLLAAKFRWSLPKAK